MSGLSNEHTGRPIVPFLAEYPEWDNLVFDAAHGSPEAVVTTPGDQYVELRRTLASLYALNNAADHLTEGDDDWESEDETYDRIVHPSVEAAYEAFVEGQPEEVKLPFEDYNEVSELVAEALYTTKLYRCMQSCLLISDALKNPKIMAAMGLNENEVTHDEALQLLFAEDASDALVAVRQRYFPSFDNPEKHDDEDRATIRPWIKLMGFNLPGWAQSQASVSHLELFPESLGRKLRLQFILHGMLDVMGVRGNENQTSALAYTKPTHDMFIAAVKALTWSAEELGLPVGTEMTPDLRERAYLQLRAVYFGVTQDYYQHTCRPVDPVLAEVATMPLGEQILVDAHATMNARELLAQIRLANAARYSSHKQFAALRRAYADCSYLDLEPITDIMGLSQLKILFPLFDIHQPQKDFVFDYLPAFIRPLLSGDHETLKRNLKLFAGILYEIRYAYGNLPRLDEFEDQPSVDMVAVFKTLAQRAKESKSSTKETGILVRQVGNVLVPEIVTLEEKFSYEDDLAQQKRLTMLRQYWGGRDDIPDHIRRELEES